MSPKSSELDKYRVESRTLNSLIAMYALRAKTCACFDSSQLSSKLSLLRDEVINFHSNDDLSTKIDNFFALSIPILNEKDRTFE